MGIKIEGSQGHGPVSSMVQKNKELAENALNKIIQEAKNDPAKNIRELQQPSPFSQFLDIKA